MEGEEERKKHRQRPEFRVDLARNPFPPMQDPEVICRSKADTHSLKFVLPKHTVRQSVKMAPVTIHTSAKFSLNWDSEKKLDKMAANVCKHKMVPIGMEVIS